ncbi:MAG: hypothetical protein IKN36_04575 [Clostridia bacterium]|nr:hypothetical protein [Clostridia bacterium]
MEIIGQTVRHKTLGEGKVEKADGRFLSIAFSCGVKTFVYPDTFGKFLVAVDPAFAKQVESDLAADKSAKEKNDALRREEAKCFSHGIVIPGRAVQAEDEGQSAFVKDDDEDN